MDNKIFDQIITEISSGNFKDAIKNCDEILNEYPENRSVYEIRSGCYYALGDYDSAISDLTYSIGRIKEGEDSRDEIINLYTKRGKIHLEKSEWLKAAEDFRKILLLNQSLPEIQNSLAVCYRRIDNYSDALYHSTQAIKLNHEYAEAYNNRANINISLEKYHEAISDYSRSIELNPLNANAYFNRGSIYYDVLCSKENAIQDFLKSISINPNFKEELKNNYPELLNVLDEKQSAAEENVNVSKEIESTKEDVVDIPAISETVISEEIKETLTTKEDIPEIKEEEIIPEEEEITPEEEEITPKEEEIQNTEFNNVSSTETGKEDLDFSLDDYDSLFKERKETKVEAAINPMTEPVRPASEEIKKDDIVIPTFDFKSMFSNIDESNEPSTLDEESLVTDKPIISESVKQLHDEIHTNGENEKESSVSMGGIKFGGMSEFKNKEPVFSNDSVAYKEERIEEKRSFLRSPVFFLVLIGLMAIIIIISVFKFFISQETQIVNTQNAVTVDSNKEKKTDTLKEEVKETGTKNAAETKTETKPEETKKEEVTTKEEKREPALTTKNLGFISDKKVFVLFSEPDGYYVQIGSYKEKPKADEKVKLLEKNNIKGKVIEANLGDKGIFYRVRAGVFSSPEEAKEKTIKIE